VTITTGAQRVPLQTNRTSLQEKKFTSANSRPTSKLPEILSLPREDEQTPMEVVIPTSDALALDGALLEEDHPLTEALLDSGKTLQTIPVWPALDPTIEQECSEQIKLVRESFTEEIDHYDTTMVSEYSEDIMQYMSELEISTMPISDYISTQSEITW
jgi:G2/mitotic-specific cyclin 2